MVLPISFINEQPYPNLYELNKKFKEYLDKGEYEKAKEVNRNILAQEKDQIIFRLMEYIKAIEAENKLHCETITRLRNQIESLSNGS